jgi:hypothetical protein
MISRPSIRQPYGSTAAVRYSSTRFTNANPSAPFGQQGVELQVTARPASSSLTTSTSTGSSQFDLDLLPQSLPQPTPTSPDSDRHALTRSLRKSASLGHYPTSSDTRRAISRLRAESGLRDGPTLRFHDLRHTASTLALRRGVALHTVSRMLGYSDPAMTLRRYARVLEHIARGRRPGDG